MPGKQISIVEGMTSRGSSGRRKRNPRPIEEKRRIVEETFEPGMSVARVARRHDVNANQVFAWRREYLIGKPGGGKAAVAGIIQVGVVGADSVIHPVAPESMNQSRKQQRSDAGSAAKERDWPIEVELRNGVRARFDSCAEDRDIRRILVLARELA